MENSSISSVGDNKRGPVEDGAFFSLCLCVISVIFTSSDVKYCNEYVTTLRYAMYFHCHGSHHVFKLSKSN